MSYQVGRPEGSARHKIDFFHVFHIQLFEDADGTGVFKTAFKRQAHESVFHSRSRPSSRRLVGIFMERKKIFHGFNAGQRCFSKST